MSGDDSPDDQAQLAVMDAIVFFVVAMVISSLLLYHANIDEEIRPQEHGSGSADPDAVLGAVLHASVGSEVFVPMDAPRHIPADTEVCRCLLLEAEQIIGGTSAKIFEGLNCVLSSILERTSNPVYSSCLSLFLLGDSVPEKLFSISNGECLSSQSFSSCAGFSLAGGEEVLIQLCLAPTLLAEVRNVANGQLDFGAGVIATSSDLDP